MSDQDALGEAAHAAASEIFTAEVGALKPAMIHLLRRVWFKGYEAGFRRASEVATAEEVE